MLVGKTISTACYGVAVLLYAFMYPALSEIADGAAYWAGSALVMAWAPGIFLVSLFADDDGA